MASTLWTYNFVNNGPLVTILVPLERSRTGLSNGTKIVTNGPVLTKLWTNKVVTGSDRIGSDPTGSDPDFHRIRPDPAN